MRLLTMIRTMLLLRLLATLATLLIPAAAMANPGDVQTAWRLLDYVAVDYSGAVANGRIKSASEYAEMNEFAASVSARLHSLPAKPERQALIQGAANLQAVIAGKGPTEQVATLARGLATDLLRAYPVPLAPDKAPDLASGHALFQQTCAACHGMTGDGNGPDAAKLTTPPIAFTDAERARQRSVFALYQVVTQGIDGTAMQSFADRPNDQRWASAFLAGSFAFSDEQAREGERLWKAHPALRQRIPDLKTLVALTPAALATSIGRAKADAVMAYLRRHPDQVMQQAPGSLTVARAKLAASVAAAERGDARRARELALSAYLDGFEPIEPTLTARDATLMGRIEGAMGEFRAAIDRGASPDDLAEKVSVLDALFDDAEAALAPDAATDASTFLGAFTILLREGLEALGSRHLCDRHQRREPGANRRLRLAIRRNRAALGWNMDARQSASRSVATLYPGEDVAGAHRWVGLVPVRARVCRGLSRGLRDDPVLCRSLVTGERPCSAIAARCQLRSSFATAHG
jgi:high-affinity iron transporter